MHLFPIRTSLSLFTLLSILAVATLPVRADAQPNSVTLTPSVIAAGSPELIRVEAPSTTSIEGDWQGHPLQFFAGRGGHSWFALTGVDVEAKTGPAPLHILVHAGTVTRDLTRSVDIQPAHYRTGSLTVAPRYVEPDPEALKQIKAESELKSKIFTSTAAEPLWSGSFRKPVTAPPTDSFGTRRMFNGTLASVHKGMDFRAASGTTVRAANSGVIVLARPLYYEGNCVVIDHGLGLYTLSMHLSRIDVREGQPVVKGERVGLSGATGRVTGPHLHWAVRWQNAYLDPAMLLHLNLTAVR
jgi:hypothetical protein